MKKLTSLSILFFIAISMSFSQSAKEEIEYYQAIFGMNKKAIVADFLKIESNKAFWELYDQYETERKELGKKRIELLNNYAENYFDLNDEKTNELLKQMSVQKKSLDKLIDKYTKKVTKVAGVKAAVQFYQIENYFLSAIRVEIFNNIPFIGELN